MVTAMIIKAVIKTADSPRMGFREGKSYNSKVIKVLYIVNR